ncbi:MAG: SH3 domain-containing protein [Pseudomonadota bacterium]
MAWKTVAFAGLIAAGSSIPALACGGNPVCTVVDPTGTPLNIRSAPKGKIIGSAVNGTRLEFIDHQTVGNQTWARVGRFDANSAVLSEESGYVFGRYLTCNRDLLTARADNPVRCRVTDPTGTPLNIRATPGGDLVGSIRNGQVVRVESISMRRGKPWALAWRDPSDNAVGWVYDPYLKCEEDGH